MALRLFLVGVVASLALDLPRGETWTRWEARIADARPSRSEPVAVSPVMAFAPELTPLAAPLVVEISVAPPASAPAPTPVEPKLDLVAVPAPPAPAPAPAVVVEVEPDMMDPIDMEDVEIAEVPVPASVPMAEPAPAPAAPALAVVDPDAAFQSSLDRMASGFVADVAPPADAILVEVEPLAAPAVEAELDPILALLLGRGAAIVSPDAVVVVEPIKVAVIEEVVIDEPTAAVAPEPVADAVEDSSTDRLARAVRLTGQAVNAWASLLQQDSTTLSIRR